MTASHSIPAIDVHAHYGTYVRDGVSAQACAFMSASAQAVASRARACSVEWTLVSPLEALLPRERADAVAGNRSAHREVPATPGLLQYVVVNPHQPATFEQARDMLRSPWCVAVKLHPEEHGYRISKHGDRLLDFIEELGVPVMAHTGCANSLPQDFVPVADRHPGVRLLLAHLGNGAGDENRADLQVRAVQECRYGNVWIDTSSARNLLPGLVEWAVRELGPERLLFGSDSPLYHLGMQRARIDTADIPERAKRLILRENALTFFNLSDRLSRISNARS